MQKNIEFSVNAIVEMMKHEGKLNSEIKRKIFHKMSNRRKRTTFHYLQFLSFRILEQQHAN